MDVERSEPIEAPESGGEAVEGSGPAESGDVGAPFLYGPGEVSATASAGASDGGPEGVGEEPDGDTGGKKGKKGKKKKNKPTTLGSSRGIETMFRTSYRVHQDLVSLADAKANIMISVNGLIISITLAALAPRIGGLPLLVLPVSILLLGCLVALVYAVLAARPRVSSQPLTLEDIDRNDSNILFFGNFVNLSEEDFVEGMKNLMLTPDHLYINMVRDLYGLGQVLKKKFRLLRISYTVFMIALILGVGGLVLVFALDATIAQDLLDAGAMLPTIP